MHKIIDLRPKLKRRRNPWRWAWHHAAVGCTAFSRERYSVSWWPPVWLWLFPPSFLSFIIIACLARVPLKESLFEIARQLVRQFEEGDN